VLSFLFDEEEALIDRFTLVVRPGAVLFCEEPRKELPTTMNSQMTKTKAATARMTGQYFSIACASSPKTINPANNQPEPLDLRLAMSCSLVIIIVCDRTGSDNHAICRLSEVIVTGKNCLGKRTLRTQGKTSPALHSLYGAL
jgi:hypothetical protein